MSKRAADILSGPIGQLLLATRALAVVGSPLLLEHELRFFSDRDGSKDILERASGAIAGDPGAVRTFVGAGLLEDLGAITDGFHHGFAIRGRAGIRWLASNSSVLRLLERAVARSASNRWWWGPMGGSQRITESVAGVRYDRAFTTYDTADGWCSVPQTRSTLMTTRGPILEGSSVAAVCGEDLAVDHPRTTAFAVPKGPVFEVHSAQDFIRFVERYPRQWKDSSGEWMAMTGVEGPWVGPDWEAVADDYSGVHLSVSAYLNAAYRALPTRFGFALISGWDADGTVWFNQIQSTPVG